MQRRPTHARAEVTATSRPTVLRWSFGASRVRELPEEDRRAFALLRALDLAADADGARALLKLAGRDPPAARDVVISESDCQALAAALKKRGYPLTSRGVRAFKMERGFSAAVRIAPDVASAYAGLARGRATRIELDVESTKHATPEQRRALDVLRVAARVPGELRAVMAALGSAVTEADPGQVLRLSASHADALLEWGAVIGWSFDDVGFARLAKAVGAAPDAVTATSARFIIDAVLARGEPAHDYTRVKRGEFSLNQRTLAMLQDAQDALDERYRLRIIKGSYDSTEERGAHPHQGGGAVDLSVRDLSLSLVDDIVKALREAGFAAWYRPRPDRPHIHAVAIGDREMSAAAAWQVRAFFRGTDGRSRSGPDPHGHLPMSLPRWLERYRVTAQ